MINVIVLYKKAVSDLFVESVNLKMQIIHNKIFYSLNSGPHNHRIIL